MSRNDFLRELGNKNINRRYTSDKSTFIKFKKLASRALAVGLVGLTLNGFSGCTKNSPQNPSSVPEPSLIQADSTYLSTSDEILNDFKVLYADAYDKANKASINPYDLELISSYENFLYVTHDGQYVTHGSDKEETEKVLSEYGEFSSVSIGDYGTLLQVLYKDEPLEYFFDGFVDDMEHISTSVLSGNNLNSLLDKLESKEGLKNPVLEKYSSLADDAIEANSDYHNNISFYIRSYNEHRNEIIQNNEDRER